MKLAYQIQEFKNDSEQIRAATDYNESCIKRGSGCDSSASARRRVEYVLKAEAEFVEKHKLEILKLAVNNLETEIKEAIDELSI